MSDPAALVSPEDRETLAALADVLVPAAVNLPAASEIDVAGRWLDRALRALPEIGPDLARVLAGARDRDPAAEARRLHAEDQEGFRALSLAVTGAYYMHPRVRRRVG